MLGRRRPLSVLRGVGVHEGGGGGADEEFQEVTKAHGTAGQAVPVGGEGVGERNVSGGAEELWGEGFGLCEELLVLGSIDPPVRVYVGCRSTALCWLGHLLTTLHSFWRTLVAHVKVT